MSAERHQREASDQARRTPVGCGILTVSDTRTPETDTGGELLVRLAAEFDHRVVERRIVKDEPGEIKPVLADWISRSDIQAVLVTGGTGIANRDTTIEVVRSMISVELEGFGELFRMLSWHQVKSSAMMSRAVAGLVSQTRSDGGDTFIFAMPGSLNAIETAMSNLIGPQLAHLVWERSR